jgi:hypothetical protein
MMTLNKAKRIALESLADRTGRSPTELVLVDELTECKRLGWIFFYESRAFIESGDVQKAIGKTGPVVVTHCGQVHHLRGDRPAAEVIRELEKAQQSRRVLH